MGRKKSPIVAPLRAKTLDQRKKRAVRRRFSQEGQERSKKIQKIQVLSLS